MSPNMNPLRNPRIRRPWNRSLWDRRDREGDSDVHTLIGAYALDALDQVDRDRVERHLAICDTCATDADELRATTSRLADTTVHEPPPQLRSQVLAAAARTPQLSPPPRSAVEEHPALRQRLTTRRGLTTRRAPTAQRGPVRWLAAAAAAVAVLAGGTGIGYAAQQHRVDQAHRQASAVEQRDTTQRARLDALLAAPDATLLSRAMPDGTHLRMIMSARRDQAAVYLTDLAPTPIGRTYQLWLISGATATNEGVLPVGSGAYSTFLTGLHGKDAFGMSIEPEHGSPAPTAVYTVMPLT